MSSETDQFLLQTDNRDLVHNRLARGNWIFVYKILRGNSQNCTYFSALIPNAIAQEVLRTASWDLPIGSGLPSCECHYDGETRIIEYQNLGVNDRIIPLVIRREFHDMEPNYSEILEEFRLFHNLYHDERNNVYIKFHDNGNEEKIIIVEENAVQIKKEAIRQFLAIKEMHLAVYFEFDRFSSMSIDDIDPDLTSVEVRENNLTYDFYAERWTPTTDDVHQSFSTLFGKIFVPGVSKERSGIWPYSEDENEQQYLDFIIRISDEGEAILNTCNPRSLANSFGGNPDSPHYLTPVFFRREVLSKYFNNPAKFAVKDGYLQCGGLWGLRLDNNHSEYVVVYLGDLGTYLPHEERMYWRSFNVPPEGTISEVYFKRSILAEFADPGRADLLFKYRFEQFQKRWEAHFGWPLFKPLGEDDQHLYTSLRIPLTNDQAEFDGQILALTKIIIDSLNEKQLAKSLPSVEPNTRGIRKLEKFLEFHGVSNIEQTTGFLRNLYSLRSTGVGHRKGRNYRKIARTFRIGERDLTAVFDDLLCELIAILDALEAALLPS